MPMTICPNHSPATVLHDDTQVCPVCAALDDITDRAKRAEQTLADIMPHLTALLRFVGGSHTILTPVPEPVVTTPATPAPATTPAPKSTPEDDKVPQVLAAVRAAAANGVGATILEVVKQVDDCGIRIVKNAYREDTGTSAGKKWDANTLAKEWSKTLCPAPAEPPAAQEPVQPPADPEPSADTPEPAPTQPEATSADDDAPEPEPNEREAWVISRIKELKSTVESMGDLATLYEAATETTAPPTMDAVAMRQAIAEHDYDHRNDLVSPVSEDDIPF